MRIAIMAVILIISTQFIPVTALTDDEKTVLESMATGVLMQTDLLSYGLVEIDYGNTMNIWFMPNEADQDIVAGSVASSVGLYVAACNLYPEISDLRLMLGQKDNVAGEMYCERAWVDEVRRYSDGSFNTNDMGLVVLKVLGTLKDKS